MIDSNIIALESRNIPLLNGNDSNRVFDTCSITDGKLYTRTIESIRYETFEKVWLSHIDSSKDVLLMAYKTKPQLDYYIYGDYCGTAKMQLNSGFVKYLNSCNILGEKINPITFTNIITIDISTHKVYETLYDNGIGAHDIIYNYTKKVDNPTNVPFDIPLHRNKMVDRVSLYKVGTRYLVIGYSKKAKKLRRVFEINPNFMKYLNTVDEFKLSIPGCVTTITTVVNPNEVRLDLDLKVAVIGNETANVDTKISRTDIILDKIAMFGVESLTAEEKRYLDNL